MKINSMIAWTTVALVSLTACGDVFSDPPPLGVESEGESSSSTTGEAGSSTSGAPSSTSVDPDGGSMTSVDPDDGSTTSGGDTSGTTTDDTGTTTESRPSCNEGPTPADALAFGAPVPLPGVNTASNEVSAWLSPDELVVWLSAERPEGVGGYDVYRSTRDDPSAAFGPATLLVELSTPAEEQVQSLSTDMLTLYGSSDGIGSMGGFDVMVATRASTLAAFGPLTPLASINSGAGDMEPRISADGTELYFSTTRAGTWDVYRAELDVGGSFGAPTVVEELSSPDAGDGNVVLSTDGLTIYFASTREDPTWNVHVATRSTRDDGFGPAVSVTDVNVDGVIDLPVWLSSDGCRLVLMSDRPGEGGHDLWIAEREP